MFYDEEPATGTMTDGGTSTDDKEEKAETNGEDEQM
jgi:hypothetical protein